MDWSGNSGLRVGLLVVLRAAGLVVGVCCCWWGIGLACGLEGCNGLILGLGAIVVCPGLFVGVGAVGL